MTGKKYNLSDPNDREILIRNALDFDASLLLELHDDMFKAGHRGSVTDLDKKMYYWLGPEYDRACESVFEFSYLEADYLKIDNNSKRFHDLCDKNREIFWNEIIRKVLPEMQVGAKVKVAYPSKTEMMQSIIQRHTKSKLEKKLE